MPRTTRSTPAPPTEVAPAIELSTEKAGKGSSGPKPNNTGKATTTGRKAATKRPREVSDTEGTAPNTVAPVKPIPKKPKKATLTVNDAVDSHVAMDDSLAEIPNPGMASNGKGPEQPVSTRPVRKNRLEDPAAPDRPRAKRTTVQVLENQNAVLLAELNLLKTAMSNRDRLAQVELDEEEGIRREEAAVVRSLKDVEDDRDPEYFSMDVSGNDDDEDEVVMPKKRTKAASQVTTGNVSLKIFPCDFVLTSVCRN